MINPRGISGDLYRPVRRSGARRGELPLPPGMPRRVHQVPATPRPVRSQPGPQAKPSRSKPLWDFAQYPVIAAVALGASANSTFGQLVLAGYGLTAILIRRLPSSLTFTLALVIDSLPVAARKLCLIGIDCWICVPVSVSDLSRPAKLPS